MSEPMVLRSVRVSVSLWAAAMAVAKKRGESLSADVIRPALERYVKRHS